MRKYREEVVTYKRDIEIECKCDLCGEDTEAGGYDVSECIIRMSRGTDYPGDGRSVQETEYDICVKCFGNKLIPWMESQGATARIKERW